ncbi:MAG: hypothetical protein O9264_07955 [Leptospira sp.]|nr:hypothetical protein [Leptospira sp.]
MNSFLDSIVSEGAMNEIVTKSGHPLDTKTLKEVEYISSQIIDLLHPISIYLFGSCIYFTWNS